MNRKVLFTGAAVVMTTGVFASAAHANDDPSYQFTKMVEGDYRLTCSSIYDDGSVMFRDGRQGQESYHLATPESVETLLTHEDLGSSFGIGMAQRNDAGDLALGVADRTTGWEIATVSDEVNRTIATTDHPILVAEALSMNDQGQVLHYLTQRDYSRTLVVWDDGEVVQEIARDDGPIGQWVSAELNNDGQVAVSGYSAGEIATYIVEDGVFTEVVDSSTLPYPRMLDFNDQETVLIRDGSGTLSTVSVGGQVGTVADGDEFSVAYYDAAMNDQGDVVFEATHNDTSTSGVFSGEDPIADKVLARGDSLFGDTVNSVGLCGINDDGDVALQVVADGQRMIVVAEKN